MRTSPIALTSVLVIAFAALACSSGTSEEAPETGPAAAPNTVLTTNTMLTEQPPAPEAVAITAPLRFTALREGRAYEGAPPVIAHPIGLGTDCAECHLDGSEGFEDVGTLAARLEAEFQWHAIILARSPKARPRPNALTHAMAPFPRPEHRTFKQFRVAVGTDGPSGGFDPSNNNFG